MHISSRVEPLGLIAQIREDFQFHRSIDPEQGFLGSVLDRHFLVCANYRFGYWSCRLRVPVVGKILRACYVLSNLIISAMSGTDIRTGAIIGRRFSVHTSFGVMIADGAIIGDDCTVFTGACVVNKANKKGEGQPRIGNNVTLGAGCKILGGITVGDNVTVGANAVVIQDVPANHIAVGVPARNRTLRAPTQACEPSEAEEVSLR